MPRVAPADPDSGGPAVGVRQRAGVDHQVLVAAARPLYQDPLALQAHQEMAAPVGRDVLAAEGLHEPGLLPGLQQRGPGQRAPLRDEVEGDLGGTLAQGLIDSVIGLAASHPGLCAVHEGHAQPVVVDGGGDVDGAAHGPGADQVAAREGRPHVTARGAAGAHDQGVRHRGDLLPLDGELTAHGLDGCRRGGGPDQTVGDDPQQRGLPGQDGPGGHGGHGGHGLPPATAAQKRRELGSSMPRMAS